MGIPNTVENTPAGVLKFLEDTINLADKSWTPYAWLVSGAYASAYKKNLAVLTRIKGDQYKAEKEAEASMALALSFLTVGVAGGVAGALARKYTTKKTFEDAAKQVLQLAQRTAADPAVKVISEALSPDKPAGGDVCAPSDTDPTEYTAKLHFGITHTVGLLTKIIYDAQYNPSSSVKYDGKSYQMRSGGVLTLEGARSLTEAILDSNFIKEMPSSDIDPEVMARKASLALWIGWASVRDVEYWQNHPSEEYDWDPLRRALVDLGVPQTLITVSDHRYPKPNYGLNFMRLISWSTGPHAMALLFDDKLPTNAKGFEMVSQRKTKWVHTVYGEFY